MCTPAAAAAACTSASYLFCWVGGNWSLLNRAACVDFVVLNTRCLQAKPHAGRCVAHAVLQASRQEAPSVWSARDLLHSVHDSSQLHQPRAQ